VIGAPQIGRRRGGEDAVAIDTREFQTSVAEVAGLEALPAERGAWGMRAQPGKRGLTLDDINGGAYGVQGDRAADATYRPRGAAAWPGVARAGYGMRERSDVWAENASFLYEEAVQRQWSSATDIPWTQLTPLAEELERAMCQLCTFLTEVEFVAGDVPGKWIPQIPLEFFEAKLFLSSQVMDEARHLDVFRKRALANGGGLMQETGAAGLRNIMDSRDFTEMSAIMHVLSEGFVQSLFRCGEWIGQTDVDKRIFRMCAQDESRHLAFGVMHLKYVLEQAPERREEIHAYLDKGEGNLYLEAQDNAMFEAVAMLLGGGREQIDKGMEKFLAVRKKQVNEYAHRLEVAGLGERRERMGPFWKMFLN
jgi:hypothetical protein